jgi:hypothetical protein
MININITPINELKKYTFQIEQLSCTPVISIPNVSTRTHLLRSTRRISTYFKYRKR